MSQIYIEHFTDKSLKSPILDSDSATSTLKKLIFYELLDIKNHHDRDQLFAEFYNELYSYGEITPQVIMYAVEQFKERHHA